MTAAAHGDVWGAVAIHLWQTTIVLVLLAALDRVLVRAPARLRAGLWWIGVAKLAVPAAWVGAALGAITAGAAASDVMITVRVALRTLDPVLSPAALTGASWPAAWFSAIWAVGAAALVAIFVRRGFRARRREPLAAPADSLRAKLAMTGVDPADVRLASGPCSPHLAGVVRPRIVVPAGLAAQLSDGELVAVLLHEEAHRRRRDPLRQLLLLPLLVAYWFFPPAWWLLRRLGECEESACDEAVLAAGVPSAVYSRAIARAIGHGLEIPFGAVSLAGRGRGSLARRLRELPEIPRRSVMSRHRLALLIALAVVGAAFLIPGTGTPLAQETAHPELARLGAAGATRITLLAEDLPLREVLAEITRQTGVEIAILDGLDAEMPLRIDLRDVTAVEALGLVADLVEANYEVRQDGRALSIYARAPVRVGGDVQVPERLAYIPPLYPQAARDDHVQGIVILEATVDVEGNVTEVTVLRGVREDLDEAARESVRRWKYAPAVHDGRPVEVLLTVTVRFLLQ